MLFLRAAALGIAITLAGWIVAHPTYLTVRGVDFVRGNLDYIGPVQTLLAGGTSATFVPPLFPLLLSTIVKACEGGALAAGTVYAVVVLLSVGMTTGMIAVLLPKGSVSSTRALWGAALWAANPLAFWFSTYVSPETLFLPLSVAGIAAMLRAARSPGPTRYGWAALSGAALGVAMLTRPIGIGVPVVLAIALAWDGWASNLGRRKAALGAGAVIIVSAVLVTMPWEVRLYSLKGRVLPLSDNGPGSVIDGLTYATNPDQHRVPIHAWAASRRAQDWWLANRAEFLEGRRSVASGVAERLRADPSGMLALIAEKAAWSWYATYRGNRTLPLLVMQVLIVAGLVTGSMRAWRSSTAADSDAVRLLVVTGWLVIGYTWCMTIMVLSIARYMIPATAPLFALAGFFTMGRRIRRETGGIPAR